MSTAGTRVYSELTRTLAGAGTGEFVTFYVNTNEIVEALRHFEGNDWDRLDQLLEQLWATGEPQQGVESLLGIFERYPEDDGNGVFWSI